MSAHASLPIAIVQPAGSHMCVKYERLKLLAPTVCTLPRPYSELMWAQPNAISGMTVMPGGKSKWNAPSETLLMPYAKAKAPSVVTASPPVTELKWAH